METSLLATKLFVPPARPGLVPRPRLMERLQTVLTCRLTLVSAQAGYGKSTVLTQWIAENKLPGGTAWVSLDEGDNDPVRFWDYFIAALKTIKPAIGETSLGLLHSPQPYPTESVLTALINDLATETNDYVVVLDDYHLVKSEPVHAGVTFLLDHLPPGMHLVIATRADPHLPLAHLRGRGQLMEIGADDLRFTVEETAALLKDTQGPTLSKEDITALNAHTEGWGVGLKMAALFMHGQRDVKAFLANFTGSQRYIMDYLIEELLKQQSTDVRDFLLRTSVLERMTGPLCDYLIDHGGGGETLTKLEATFGGFLVPLDESRHWYRYHHLLAELLRHQLERVSGSEEVTRLQRRASQWYEEHHLIDDAVRHSLAAKDWELAMRLIYSVSEARIKRGEWSTLFNWFRLIPDEILRSNPRLYSHYANVVMSFGPSEPLEIMLGYLERTAIDDTALQGEVAFYRSMQALRKGNDAERLKSVEKALALLPPDNLSLRARARSMLGAIKFEMGQLREADAAMTDAYEMARLPGNYWVSVAALAYMSAIVWLRGELHRATELILQAIDLAGHLPVASVATSLLGIVKYEENDLEGAADNAQRANEMNELRGEIPNRVHTYFYLAQVHLIRGDVASAGEMMKKSDRLLSHPHMTEKYRAIHMAYHILFALHQNDLEDAAGWGERLSKHSHAPWMALWWVPARLMIARGDKTAASAQLKDLYEKAATEDARGLVIVIRVCQALAADSPSEGLAFLAEALTLGEPEGFIRTFVDEGKLLAPLLRRALSKGITPEYTSRLLKIIEDEEQKHKAENTEAAPSTQPSGLLSERELEILRLVAAGQSNREIAAKLVIALGTAKTHVHRIFEKLNAKDRLQAVTKARELKLV